VQAGEGAILPETPQQCLTRAPVLRRIESHPGEGAAPGPDLRQLTLGRVCQPGTRDRGEFRDAIAGCGIGGDPVGEHRPRNELGEVTPDLTGMLELHEH
jgi:hypothetical protein